MPPLAPRTHAPAACTRARRLRHQRRSLRVPVIHTPRRESRRPRPTSFPQHRCRALPPSPNTAVAPYLLTPTSLSRPAVGPGSCRGQRWGSVPVAALDRRRHGMSRPDPLLLLDPALWACAVVMEDPIGAAQLNVTQAVTFSSVWCQQPPPPCAASDGCGR
jgi:hypothetical protein